MFDRRLKKNTEEMRWTCDQLFVLTRCLWGRPLQQPAGKVKGFQNWWQKWLLHKWRWGFLCSPSHTIKLQSNKDKIMQITFLSDGPAFFASLLLLYRRNCSVLRKLSRVFSTALFFCRDPRQSERGKKGKEPSHGSGFRLNWQPIVKRVQWKFDAADCRFFFFQTSITIFSPLCRAGAAFKAFISRRWGHSGSK